MKFPISTSIGFDELVNFVEAVSPQFDWTTKIHQYSSIQYGEQVRALGVYSLDNNSLVFKFFEHPNCTEQTNDNEQFINVLNTAYAPKANIPSTDWDVRFLRMAAGEINSWSKDPSTKVSAILFRGKYPLMPSYNGFPPGIEDTVERLNDREVKYKLVQHAEMNAVSTCARMGISTEGASMAITHLPCTTCAGLLISAGIKRLIVKKPNEDFMSRWKDSVEFALSMFEEAGVEVRMIDLDSIDGVNLMLIEDIE